MPIMRSILQRMTKSRPSCGRLSSSADLNASIIPSIIPLGAIISAPAFACTSACIADISRVASFDVPYQPGELKAICYENGKEVGSKILKTSGNPSAIRLVADRTKIKADRSDLAFVKIEVVDNYGQLVPQDSVRIELSVSGNGGLIASGNASPNDMESFNNPIIKTFQGKGLAIVRPTTKAGKITIKATANGLKPAQVDITTTK